MVSITTRLVVWARAAGRCEYPGCNDVLIGDLISGTEDANFGFIAHIVADKPTGPRGDLIRSPLLSDDPGNLMLLCHRHHKLIDVDDLTGHPEPLLLRYKAEHEDRIQTVTAIQRERASHVLRYGARIGEHTSPVTFERVRVAMLPQRYPAEGRSIGIQLLGAVASDREEQYWVTEIDNLRRHFDRLVHQRKADGEIRHLSVFALAPIPLLVELGRLLGDIAPADVYQLHREPSGWSWAHDKEVLRCRVEGPFSDGPAVALSIGISATIHPDRIRAVLGKDTAIWSLSVDQPHNDIIRQPDDLKEFRSIIRSLLGQIRVKHPNALLNVFPAMPVSAAIELGRVWMPKADLPLLVFDESPGKGFVPRVKIESTST
jgi:hypothetical protein